MIKNESMPLVSVVIPMYNCENYIDRCIKSLLQQTYDCIEILVVDDGSSDAGAEIIKQYMDKDCRICYFYQNNAGPAVARNVAIQQAAGKYLLFVDADDYVGPNYIEELVITAENHKSELVITGYTMVFEGGGKNRVIIPEKYEKYKVEEWAYRISACCSRMYLREFWEKHDLQFYQEAGARAEDVPIALYSNLMAKNIAVVKDAGYYYYQHQGSAMNNKNQKMLFKFPYHAFRNMYNKISIGNLENSLSFYYMGILKFLAQFDLVIYRNASQDEKGRFRKYLENVIGNDYNAIIKEWNRNRIKVKFPIHHKIAIQLFVWKYKSIIER